MADSTISFNWNLTPIDFATTYAAYLVKSESPGYGVGVLAQRFVGPWKNWVDEAIIAAQAKDREFTAFMTTGAIGDTLIVGDGTTVPSAQIDGTTAGYSIDFKEAGITRWKLDKSGTGAFGLKRHDAAGAFVADCWSVSSAGATTLGESAAATTVQGSTVTVTGPATCSGTLGVTGAATCSSTLAVTGAATFSSTISAGATTVSSLTVTGNATISGTILTTGTAMQSSVTQKPGGASTTRIGATSNAALASVAHHIGVNDGSRGSRAEFFVKDDISGSGAWGHWLSWASGGFQPYVIGAGSTELVRADLSTFTISTNASIGGTLSATGATLSTAAVSGALASAGQLLVGGTGLVSTESRGITIRGGTGGSVRIAFGDADAPEVGSVAYFNSSDALNFASAGAFRTTLTSAAFAPFTSSGITLGTSTLRFGNVFSAAMDLSGAATIGGQALIGGATGSGAIRAVGTNGMFTCQDTATDSAAKTGRWGVGAYVNSQSPLGVIHAVGNVGTNTVHIGGGTAQFQAATQVAIFAASAVNTATGTQVASFTSSLASFAVPVGLPTYTTAARPAASTAGRVIFNTTTNRPNYDTGTGWVHSDGSAA